MSWTSVELSKITRELESGSRPKGGVRSGEEGVPSLGGEHLNDSGDIETRNAKCVPAAFFESLRSGVVRPNDLLIVKDGATTGKIAFVGPRFPYERASVNEHVFRVALDLEAADPAYVFWFLHSQEGQREILKDFRGSTVGGIGRTFIDRALIPLPPLPHQKRLAAILDHADALRRKTKAGIRRLRQVGDSFFTQMFSHGASMPQQAIGSFAKVKGGKRLPKGTDYAPHPTSHPYIRVSDLRDGGIATGGLRFIAPEVQKKIARYTVKEGDLVISIAGTIGVVAPVPKELAGANLTENAAKITGAESGAFDSTYLSWALRSSRAQHQIASRTGQVTIGKLALFRIEEITIPFPPLQEQRKFAAGLRVLEAEIKRFERQSEIVDKMFASLQHRAFRGEL